METRANYVLIGAFTLAVIAAAFGFVLWFQSLHTTKARSPIRIVFEGPASGLRNGGSVNFNGIRIGEVISVKLDNPRRVVALAMVENNAPIRKDTLVGLEFQGLTGVAAISLKGGEETAPAVPLDEDGVAVLINDGRRTLGDISRAVNNFDRNPSRVIFGGSNNAAPAAEAAPAAPPRAAAPRPPAAAAATPSGQKRQ